MIDEGWKGEFAYWYLSQVPTWASAIDYIVPVLRLIVERNLDYYADIDGRVKTFEKSVEKFERKYIQTAIAAEETLRPQDFITDFLGFRVVCYFNDEVLSVVDALRKSFNVVKETDKIKELEAEASSFGYRAHHLDVGLREESIHADIYNRFEPLRFEIQVRTVVQDGWSRLSHKLTYRRLVPLEVSRRMARLAAMFEEAEGAYVEIRDMETADTPEPVPEAVDTSSIEEQIDRIAGLKEIDDLSLKRLLVEFEMAGGSIEPGEFVEVLEKGWGVLISKADALSKIEGDMTKLRAALYLADKVKFKNLLSMRNRQRVQHL